MCLLKLCPIDQCINLTLTLEHLAIMQRFSDFQLKNLTNQQNLKMSLEFRGRIFLEMIFCAILMCSCVLQEILWRSTLCQQEFLSCSYFRTRKFFLQSFDAKSPNNESDSFNFFHRLLMCMGAYNYHHLRCPLDFLKISRYTRRQVQMSVLQFLYSIWLLHLWNPRKIGKFTYPIC